MQTANVHLEVTYTLDALVLSSPVCTTTPTRQLKTLIRMIPFTFNINEQIELCLEFNIAEDTVLRMFSAHPCIFIEYRKCLMVHALVAFMLHQANTHIYVAGMGSNRNNPKSKEDPTTRTITSPTDHFIKTLRKGIKIDLSTLNGVHMQQPTQTTSSPTHWEILLQSFDRLIIYEIGIFTLFTIQ